jgi:hypothetical protein
MKKIIFVLLICSLSVKIQAQDLRTKLDGSYKNFMNAVKSKDADKLKSSLSAYAYMSIKNQMSSAGAKFPDDFFAAAPKMLTNLDKLQFCKVVKNGPTAYSIYWGKDKFSDTSLFIFKFLKENEEWKFNMAEEKGSKEISKSIREGDFSFLDTKKYQPDGIVPVTPVEVTAGDYKGMVDVMCYGYEVQVSINGVFQKLVKGGSYSGMIMGGIKKGKNKIELTIKPIEGEDPSTLRVTVRGLIKEKEKEVFTLEEKTPAATIVKEFEVQ